MIDVHVHLRDWQQSAKETVGHGLAVASLCGFRWVADMPNTAPALTDRETVLDRLALASPYARKHHVSYSVHMGLTADEDQIRHAVNTYNELFPRVLGLKMFAGHSTGNMGLVSPEAQRTVFRTLTDSDYRGILLVHCEKESLLRPELFVPGRFETHSAARPPEAEAESVRDMISLAMETGFRGGLHICHISTRAALDLVKKARAEGLDISCGATAHHSLLTASDAGNHDLFLKMNPPLRDESDRQAVYQGLIDGDVDFVESDHAPHTLADKEAGASGILGFAGSLLLLKRLKADGVPHARLVELFCSAAADRFGIESDNRLADRLDWRIAKAREEYPFDPFSGLS